VTDAPYQASRAVADPGRAVLLRLGAWVIDLITYLLVSGLTFLAIAQRQAGVTSFTTSSNFGDLGTSFCSSLRDSRPVNECFQLGDTAWYTTGARTVAHSVVALGWFVGIHVVLQGLTGGSLGKLAAGVRVVQADGRPPGIGRALVRSLFWLVDGFPCCAPLVGLVTLLATGRKQRVGDIVAKTFVVRARDRGQPVGTDGLSSGAPPGAVPPGQGGYGASPWYPAAPPSGPGYPPGGAYPPPRG